MRKFIILLAMSLCTFAEAQKPLEWQIKGGIYSECFQLPILGKESYSLTPLTGPKVFGTFSFGVYHRKWHSLFQVNVDTRLTYKGGYYPLEWFNATSHSTKDINSNIFYPSEMGDTVTISYTHVNIFNALYNIYDDTSRQKLYFGIGLTLRFDRILYVAYTDGFLGVVDNFKKTRLAPTFKIEYQYKVGKLFFLSSHINYAWFDQTPHSYWQFALNGGIRF
jgi:hypothetical protein